MTQYQRMTGKVFGGNATATGNDPQIAQFGSALANTFVGTTDPETIQSLPAWGQGWIGAVTPETQFPPLPEMTGVMKVLSHQICGILQQGVSTWDSGTVYYTGNFVSLNGRLYISQVDENQGNNPATDTTNWQEFSSGGGLEIGDIGIAPLGIDETRGKRRYLNGQIIVQDQYTIFTEKVKNAINLYPTLGCTEQEWQTIATMSVGGQVGKFVVDDEGGTIRLPKIIMPIQGLTNLANLAEIVEAGAPDILATVNPIVTEDTIYSSSGAIRTDMGGQNNVGDAGTKYWDYAILNFKASWSNSIYGNSTTIQQEQIQYPYFIQVATGSETEDNIINTLELNNPFVLLEPKFFESEVYNASWLLANGSYNGSNAVHPSAYQALLVENNTGVAIGSTVTLPIGTEYTKRGLSVKLSTDSNITDYDFVLNTSDETFRLPIKVNLASGKAVVGNGKALGLMDGTNGYGLGSGVNTVQAILNINNYGADVGSTNNWGSNIPTRAVGVTDDPTKSGIELSNSNLYLYFYVGETVQNANLVNIGRITEKVASLIPDNSSLISSYGMPSNKYTSLTIGASGSEYTAPANGYYTLHRAPSSGLGTITLTNTSNNIRSCCETNVGYGIRVFIPVAKGQIIRMHYNATTWNTSVDYFGFVYAIGSESEAN